MWMREVANLKLLVSCAILFIACGLASLKAEEATPADEAKEAADEEEAEKKMTETELILAIQSIRGKLTLVGTGGDDGTDVVGSMTDPSGRIYLLKLEKKELLPTLTTFNNKTVALQGKLRNKGKYLLVQGITEPGGGAAPDRKKRGGI